jgi:hypothetical protein
VWCAYFIWEVKAGVSGTDTGAGCLAACLFKMAGAGWCVVHLFRYRCSVFRNVPIKDVKCWLVCGAPI